MTRQPSVSILVLRARNYDPTTGRFTTPDTASLSTTDVTQLDRYVYAAANPINASDPSGHDLLDYALSAAVSFGGAYVAGVDLYESLALLFTEGLLTMQPQQRESATSSPG